MSHVLGTYNVYITLYIWHLDATNTDRCTYVSTTRFLHELCHQSAIREGDAFVCVCACVRARARSASDISEKSPVR